MLLVASVGRSRGAMFEGMPLASWPVWYSCCDVQMLCRTEGLPAYSCTHCLAGCLAQRMTYEDKPLLVVHLCTASKNVSQLGRGS